mmetsp:Transcript_16253/g.35182  ORF Transcript_16253/g.35182 Transcript_16253/m.35182 type:complete len:650 (+) Transcript_16253:71-2020(+)
MPRCCCVSGLSTDRLFWHTLVALVIGLSGVIAPILLFFREEWGTVSLVVGVALLAVGCGALLASATARGVESSSCCTLQWKAMLLSAWLLNPVVIVVAAVAIKDKQWAQWSAMPLLIVLMVLSGRARLSDGGPRWDQEGCPWGPSTIFYWLLNRAVFLGFPLYFLSLQVTLYLPHKDMLPDGAEVGLFVCGGLIVTSMKFCAICACLSPSERPEGGQAKVSQAFILLIFLMLDWLSIVQLVFSPNTITDLTKERSMLAALLVSGLVQLRVTLVRLQLRSRWKRACAQRRARQIGAARDLELGAELAGAAERGDSSDSDDDRGPGSVPTGFHEAFMSVLGVPEPEARREWLCPPRRAAVAETRPQPQQGSQVEAEQAVLPPPPGAASPPSSNSASPSDAGPTASLEICQPPILKISAELRHCAVCQDNINSGDQVRPMPKCNHVFHSACLEGWAKIKQEKTRCPVCRRPALNRKQTDGATNVASLRGGGDTSQASGRSSSALGTSGSESSGSRRANSERRERRRPHDPRNVRSVLDVSVLMAEAALDCTNGGDTQAIALLLEHQTFLQEVFGAVVAHRSSAAVDAGVVNAIVEANSNLAEVREHVQAHVTKLHRTGRLRRRQWQTLSQDEQREVFRVILNDVIETRRRSR